ncbi:MAG: glycerate kinase [Bacteroidales bacterium]|nr:glycerate kinase [Bacteroidales bacterium]
MMKIVLAIDSFKGCLSSIEVEKAAREGILKIYPSAVVVSLPIADGGEGTLEAMLSVNEAIKTVSIVAHDPLMRPIETFYGMSPDGKIAILEMAKTCGLTLLSDTERNPLLTTSFGLGEQIADAIDKGCKQIIIAVGGSATNDAGIGMLQALGYRFYDKSGKPVANNAKALMQTEHIDLTFAKKFPLDCSITVAVDVANPLFGENGAAFVFAPQKGASPRMVENLDKALRHFAEIVAQCFGQDYSHLPGMGAAGGVGFALKSFMNANFESGIDLLLDYVNFDRLIIDSDLIITGEGAMDRQTLMGKVPFGIVKRSAAYRKDVIAIAGKVTDKSLLITNGFKDIFCINSPDVESTLALKADYAYGQVMKTVEKIMKSFRPHPVL